MATNYNGLPQYINGYSFRQKINADGTPGVDYFDQSGKPIPNNVFAEGTGIDTSSLEQMASRQTIDASMFSGPSTRATFESQLRGAGGGGSGAGGTSGYTLQDLQAIRDAYIAQAQQAAKTQGSQGALQYSQQLQDIDQAIADNLRGAQGFVQDYGKNINAFRDSKDLGDVNRQGYFSGLSPNAFQSSQASSQDFANNKYAEGIGDYFNQAEDAVGGGFLSNPNDPTQLSETSQYGRQRGGLNQNRSGLENEYNMFTGGLQEYVANAQNGANSWYTANQGDPGNAGNIGEFNQPGSFNYVPGAPPQVNPRQVDLSNITPYTSFQSLSSVPQQGGGGYGKILNPTNPFKDGSQVDQYLGKYQTGLDPTGTDYLKKFLSGSR